MNSIFENDSYTEFLKQCIAENKNERGYQKRLAEAAGCSPSYFSAVLKDKAHLLMDHAFGICQFLQLPSQEQEFFMTLVQLGRAAKPGYKQSLQQKIVHLREKNRSLIKHSKGKQLEERFIPAYYDHWTMAAIHVLTSIPRYQNLDPLSETLGLPKSSILPCINMLVDMGLIEKKGTSYIRTERNLHLPPNSPWNRLNHINWRTFVMTNPKVSDNDFHYTAMMALSTEDLKEVRSQFHQLFADINERVKTSPEETAAIVCLDLKSLG